MRQKTVLFIICAAMLMLTLCGCAGKTDTALQSGDVTNSELRPQDIGNGSENVVPELAMRLEEVEPVSEAQNEVLAVGFVEFEDSDEYFSVLSCMVKGKVTEVKEYRKTEYYPETGETEMSDYFTLVTLKVQKNYGNKDLQYRDDDTVRFMYMQSSYEDIANVPFLEKGDTCIVGLSDMKHTYSDFSNLMELCDYYVLNPEISVIKKTEDGYAAERFMSYFDGEGTYYKLSKIEKCIEGNTDKIRNISPAQLAEEKYNESN